MSKIKYQSLSGMHDVLPEDQVYFKRVNKIVDEDREDDRAPAAVCFARAQL